MPEIRVIVDANEYQFEGVLATLAKTQSITAVRRSNDIFVRGEQSAVDQALEKARREYSSVTVEDIEEDSGARVEITVNGDEKVEDEPSAIIGEGDQEVASSLDDIDGLTIK
ncbi:hypothetical protein HOF56_01290 [Candidatus Peribacteria bacterium]|jgi:hypothetical protein|nr:hypothetical protein [Candidatus Peribacteria bacterium]MBT4020799.1 hypothetical protein [Candidatus Peribacteria bacterium]MBT4241009.1 hypothetical protein [Candidatus Peribacteria bacterium]MBT4474493.1 hypothetical protein [Candidatus Peribacteria bacterium]